MTSSARGSARWEAGQDTQPLSRPAGPIRARAWIKSIGYFAVCPQADRVRWVLKSQIILYIHRRRITNGCSCAACRGWENNPLVARKKHVRHGRNAHQMGEKAAGDGSDDGDDGFIPTCGAAPRRAADGWGACGCTSDWRARCRWNDSLRLLGLEKWSPVGFVLRGPTMIQRPVPVEETALLRMARPLLSHRLTG
jgi:hypothetical protein